MTQEILNLLKTVDTPTVCDAIEMVQGRRGFARFTRQAPVASAPDAVMVGYARTARISAAEPPTDAPDVIRARRMDYYCFMAEAPAPSIAVIEDLDPVPTGAYWGALNASVHRGFGLAGTLTNGLLRDLGSLPDGYPILAGATGPSHAFVHVRSMDEPVTVLGLDIAPGELVHGDRHGAIVIPDEMIPDLPDAISRLHRVEGDVIGAAGRAGFDFATFEEVWRQFEKNRV